MKTIVKVIALGKIDAYSGQLGRFKGKEFELLECRPSERTRGDWVFVELRAYCEAARDEFLLSTALFNAKIQVVKTIK